MASTLPNELWQRIFTFAALNKDEDQQHDWVNIWTPLRAVCKSWRSNLAQTYFNTFITYPKRCVVYFDCDWDWVPDMESGSKCIFAVEMFYDRLDASDKKRVVFRECADTQRLDSGRSEDQEFDEAYARKKYGVWKTKMDQYLCGGFEFTPYVLSIYGASLDSELPGLEYDVEKREISFEWEGMLNNFCSEYAELNRRNDDIVPQLRARAARAGADMFANPGFFGIMKAGMLAHGTNRKNNLRDVRRDRLMRFYKAKYEGLDFEMTVDLLDEEHEKEQLERIQEAEGEDIGKGEDEMGW